MQTSRLEVFREPPTPRDTYIGLSGILTLKLKALTYIHVGSGTEALSIPEDIDLIVKGKSFEGAAKELGSRMATDFIKNMSISGKPCIPASTMKGRTRTRIELTIPPRKDGRRWSCFSKASPPQNANRPTAWRHRKLYGNVVLENRGPACDLTRGNTVCLTCDMFGTAGLQGLVSFSDFKAGQNTLENVAGEFNIKLQALKPETELSGRVYFRNLSKPRLGLLLYGLGICGSPSGDRILVGRLKYRGMLARKPFGTVTTILTEVLFSKVLDKLEGVVPDTSIAGNRLTELCATLWQSAVNEYDLRMFNEVQRIGRA